MLRLCGGGTASVISYGTGAGVGGGGGVGGVAA